MSDVASGSVRVSALSMLLRIAGAPAADPVLPKPPDSLVRRLLEAGQSERDIRHALGLADDELIAALWRLAH